MSVCHVSVQIKASTYISGMIMVCNIGTSICEKCTTVRQKTNIPLRKGISETVLNSTSQAQHNSHKQIFSWRMMDIKLRLSFPFSVRMGLQLISFRDINWQSAVWTESMMASKTSSKYHFVSLKSRLPLKYSPKHIRIRNIR